MRPGCSTCELVDYWAKMLARDVAGRRIWGDWEATHPSEDEDEPPDYDEHYAKRPKWAHDIWGALSSETLDDQRFVEAMNGLTCRLHGRVEEFIHIPGLWSDGSVGPACGSLGVMSLEVYALSTDPEVIAEEREGRVKPELAMHPHVDCEECGNALVEWHLGKTVDTTVGFQWQAWLRGSRKDPAADGCTFMWRGRPDDEFGE